MKEERITFEEPGKHHQRTERLAYGLNKLTASGKLLYEAGHWTSEFCDDS